MKTWTIPRMWAGASCAVLASGASMNAEVADTIRRAHAVRVIAVNRTQELARWADLLYAADASWWQQYHPATAGFLGYKVCAEDVPFADVLRIKESGKDGFDDNPAAIRTGGNSGYGAIHIAAHAGCKRILLCGFDMHGGHWHRKHEPPLRDAGQGIFDRWLPRFTGLAKELERRGVEVLNCTPGSALKAFPQMALEDALGTVAA